MMFSRGYILGPRADWIWFLGLPYLSIVAALACHQYLPPMALASVGLWITIPHHLATWLRTYGLREDWERWTGPLIVGPVAITAATLLGMHWAPKTLFVLGLLWDHQHSLMQQHGLARIYDFKARSGGPWTGRFDLLLHCFLYGNMLITAPLFFQIWGSEIYRWQLPITPQMVGWFQNFSWFALAVFLVIYSFSLWQSVRAGHSINPIKYLFLFSSYFLWYFTSWNSDSQLTFSVAHRMMHGIQYIVIVNSYLGHKLGESANQAASTLRKKLTPTTIPLPVKWYVSHRTLAFLGMGFVYVLFYQLLLLRPLDELGFGVFSFMRVGPQVRPGMNDPDQGSGYDMFALSLIQAIPITHYYFDSFIWKVRDAKIQKGL